MMALINFIKCVLGFVFQKLANCNKHYETVILRKRIQSLGGSFYFHNPSCIAHPDRIIVGKNVYANSGLIILAHGHVKIGDYTMLGPNCMLLTSGHDLTLKAAEFRESAVISPISVGANCWLGAGVTVLAGVEIGDNCVIGAGAVVTKSLPPNSIAVGVPCRVIRKRFE